MLRAQKVEATVFLQKIHLVMMMIIFILSGNDWDCDPPTQPPDPPGSQPNIRPRRSHHNSRTLPQTRNHSSTTKNHSDATKNHSSVAKKHSAVTKNNLTASQADSPSQSYSPHWFSPSYHASQLSFSLPFHSPLSQCDVSPRKRLRSYQPTELCPVAYDTDGSMVDGAAVKRSADGKFACPYCEKVGSFLLR